MSGLSHVLAHMDSRQPFRIVPYITGALIASFWIGSLQWASARGQGQPISIPTPVEIARVGRDIRVPVSLPENALKLSFDANNPVPVVGSLETTAPKIRVQVVAEGVNKMVDVSRVPEIGEDVLAGESGGKWRVVSVKQVIHKEGGATVIGEVRSIDKP